MWREETYGRRTAEHAAQREAGLRQSLRPALLPSFDVSFLRLSLLLGILDRDVLPVEGFQDWPHVRWPVNRDG